MTQNQLYERGNQKQFSHKLNKFADDCFENTRSYK